MYHEIHKVKNIIKKEEFKELISEVI